MKVKLFSSIYEDTLEKKINDFIEEIKKDYMEVKDIKYSAILLPSNGIKYSALVMYGWDGKLRITEFKGVGESI